MSKESNTSGGIGFTGLLLIAFIVLKLCNVIDWSWWWVLSPLWMPAALAIVGFGFYLWFKIRQDKKESAVPRLTEWQQRIKKMQEAKEKLQKSESN